MKNSEMLDFLKSDKQANPHTLTPEAIADKRLGDDTKKEELDSS